MPQVDKPQISALASTLMTARNKPFTFGRISPIPDCKLDVPSCKLDIPSCKLDVPRCKLDIPDCKPLILGGKSSLPDCKLVIPRVQSLRFGRKIENPQRLSQV